MTKRCFFNLLGVLTLALLGSCANKDCYDNQNSLPLAGFYGVSNGVEYAVSVDSLRVYGIGAPNDSVLQEPESSLSELYLPFRIDQDETAYVFELAASGWADTIIFRYDRTPWFVSEQCGVVYYYDMKEITTTGQFIDSVVAPYGRITNQAIENLKIYFHVYGDEDDE